MLDAPWSGARGRPDTIGKNPALLPATYSFMGRDRQALRRTHAEARIPRYGPGTLPVTPRLRALRRLRR